MSAMRPMPAPASHTIAAILSARCDAPTIVRILDSLLSLDDDEGLTDAQAALGSAVFDRLCSMNPDCVAVASAGPPPADYIADLEQVERAARVIEREYTAETHQSLWTAAIVERLAVARAALADVEAMLNSQVILQTSEEDRKEADESFRVRCTEFFSRK